MVAPSSGGNETGRVRVDDAKTNERGRRGAPFGDKIPGTRHGGAPTIVTLAEEGLLKANHQEDNRPSINQSIINLICSPKQTSNDHITAARTSPQPT